MTRSGWTCVSYCSFTQDLLILWKTASAVLARRGAR